jgi:hypothetical protein
VSDSRVVLFTSGEYSDFGHVVLARVPAGLSLEYLQSDYAKWREGKPAWSPACSPRMYFDAVLVPQGCEVVECEEAFFGGY